MREKITVLLCGIFLIFTTAFSNAAHARDVKDWTFLVYLNGNNNLDRFGTLNINQMEMVGSNENLNIVVQWASYSARKVRRIYVQKDNDPRNVTSPVVQDMGRVDMGDWRSLAEFIQWAGQNYPAKHYVVDVWDHGSGWHQLELRRRGQNLVGVHGNVFHPTDISWDDFSGNFITTKQLGQAMTEGARAIGHKIDIYGSDACLMAMAEVAGEMKDTVQYFVGSQDLEPGAGWPYDQMLKRWSTRVPSPRDAARIMVDEYTKSYQGGSNGSQDVTMSAFDLSRMNSFNQAVAGLGGSLLKLDANDRKKVAVAARNAQKFTYDDYGDLIDFVGLIEAANLGGMNRSVLANVRNAMKDFVVSNAVTQSWAKAHGVSIWLPDSTYSYNSYAPKYADLGFQAQTHWSEALRSFLTEARQ